MIPSRYERDKELWADDPAPSPVKGRQFRDPSAPSLSSQTRAKQAERKETQRKQGVAKVTRRQRWERSPEGQTRMKDVVDYATEQHNKIAAERPELGLTPQKRLNISANQAYDHYGFKNPDPGPGMHDRQLPGMEDPDALAQPKRWEEHTPKEQRDIQSRVRRASGATLDSMTRSFGAQVDQAYIRARAYGHDKPSGSDFYTSGEPAQVLRDSAKRQGVPLGLVAATNADTSPQMKFSYEQNGHTRYPNAEQAESAVAQVKSGVHPSDVTKDSLTGMARSGFDYNFTKAAHRAHQVLNYHMSVGETFAGKNGATGFGPKTAAYHNSWLPGTPDFTVSDVHTGGGGFLPHLSSDKPLRTDEKGNPQFYESGTPKRTNSERENIIGVTGFHAMADYAARRAMTARGLGSVRQTQGAQWGEEKLRRGEISKSGHGAAMFGTPEEAYPAKDPTPVHPGQGTLFSSGSVPTVSPRQFRKPKQERLF